MDTSKILELRNQNFSSLEISKELSIDKKEIDYFLVDHYFSNKKSNKGVSKDIIYEVLKLRYEGKSFQEINLLLNISSKVTSTLLNKIGIKFLNKAYLNKDILTEESINKIIIAFKNGQTIKSLAKEYKLNVDIISNLLKENNIQTVVPSFNINIFDTIDSEEKAYWLGFIYADGNISADRNALEISLKGDDIYHLYKFKLFTHSRNKPILYLSDDYNKCRFSISNKHIKNTLISYGCVPNKSLILKFPDESVFKDKSLIKHFIRGYFDGDGCISYSYTNPGISDKITINCSLLGTYEFLLEINNICLEHNIKGSLCHDKCYKNNTWTLGFSKNNSVMFSNYLYDNCSIYLERKFERYNYFKLNNFAVLKSDFKNNDEVISEKAKNWINLHKNVDFTIHVNPEINTETKESVSS